MEKAEGLEKEDGVKRNRDLKPEANPGDGAAWGVRLGGEVEP